MKCASNGLKICALPLAFAVAAATGGFAQGAVGVVDNFDTIDGINGATYYRVLDPDTTVNATFNVTGGVLNAVQSGLQAPAEQGVLLYDVSLEQGETLLLTVAGMNDDVNGREFGIVVTGLPTGLADGASGDVRVSGEFTSFHAIMNNIAGGVYDLGWRTFNDGVEDANLSEFDGLINIDQLFITRLADDGIEVGYFSGATRTVMGSFNTVDDGYDASVFDYVGIWTDFRRNSSGGSSWIGADNLVIIPEPASLALLGLGGLMMIRRRKA